MLKTLKKYTTKITAAALAAMFLSMPMASIASAKEKHDTPPQHRYEDRYDKHDRSDSHLYDKNHKDNKYRYEHKNSKYYKNHKKSSSKYTETKASSNRKALTGFVIGAAIGAIVAKNT